MNHLNKQGPIGAMLRLRAHAKDNGDIAPRKIFNNVSMISDEVLAYCARHQLTMTWLLTGKSHALT